MRRLFLQQHQKYRLLLLLGDLLIIFGSFSLIILLETYDKNGFLWNIPKVVAVLLFISFITTSVFYILGLYDTFKPKGSTIILLSLCLGLGIVIILYSGLAYFVI